MAEVIVITKLGAARVRGHRIPRPPWRRLMLLMRVGKEIVREAVCVGGERAISIFPRGVWLVEGKVIQYVGSDEVGDLLKDAL